MDTSLSLIISYLTIVCEYNSGIRNVTVVVRSYLWEVYMNVYECVWVRMCGQGLLHPPVKKLQITDCIHQLDAIYGQ